MAKHRIFTVGFELPGDDFEYVEFESAQTLLDADIILFQPTLGYYSSDENYNGRFLLDEYYSFALKERLEHWRSEIIAAISGGKLVVVYLTEPIEGYRYTGQQNHSGTGRSHVTTKFVTEISSYEAVPNLERATPKTGSAIRLDKDASYLAPYWAEFSAYSPYQVELHGQFSRVLLRSQSGGRIVGAAVHGRTGTLLFLPPLQYDEEKFVRDDSEEEESAWTKEGVKFGKQLIRALVALEASLKQCAQRTPAPDWTRASEYRLAQESELERAISHCTEEISGLQTRKAALEAQLDDAGALRHLLYEQGRPLENAILGALKLMHFEAKPFSDGKSEFDAIFVCPEGRCLGEAEGKDNKAINIDKFSQLERNVQEDFARENVSEYAKAVLFGNAYRLSPIVDRGEFFTQKCVSAAKRTGAALVRTPDLFRPAKYLKEHPDDIQYARQCREAILSAKGEVVVFPSSPTDRVASPKE